jgi:hypothetical protein
MLTRPCAPCGGYPQRLALIKKRHYYCVLPESHPYTPNSFQVALPSLAASFVGRGRVVIGGFPSGDLVGHGLPVKGGLAFSPKNPLRLGEQTSRSPHSACALHSGAQASSPNASLGRKLLGLFRIPFSPEPVCPLPVALRLWPHVSPLARLLGWKGRAPSFSPRRTPMESSASAPDTRCDICATDSRLSSLTPRDSEGDFVWEDGSFLRPTRGSPSVVCPLWPPLEAPTSPPSPGASLQR